MRTLRVALGLAFALTFVPSVCIANTTATLPGVAVGQQSAPMMVTVTVTASGTAAAPQALTQGVPGADFQVGVGGSCAAGSTYNAGDQCTVATVFAPKYPGTRSGAVMLKSTDGRLMGSRALSGVGSGSLATLVVGRIDTVAGDGSWVYAGDGGMATQSPIFLPMGVLTDAAGNMFIADSNNYRIRRVDGQTGLMSTYAGDGTPGFAGDGGPATQAEINGPSGLALDGAGNLYFVDSANDVIRRVDAVSGVISTVAGMGGAQGYSGDGGPATSARLTLPEGIALDSAQNLYIADTGNNVVRVVALGTGIIRTLAGTGAAGYNGDGMPATQAQLNGPWGLAVAQDGSVYVADSVNNRVRRVSLQGNISTVAGIGSESFLGDGGPATQAALAAPVALLFDPAGNLYIADSHNNRVRKVYAFSGNIATITGTDGEQFAGDGGPGNLASLYGPYALYLDQAGNLLVADMFHNRIRRISATTLALTYLDMKVGKVSSPKPVVVENDGNMSMTPIAPVLVNAALDPVTTTCSAGAGFGVDGGCVLGVEFAPTTVGPVVTGSVTLGEDAGNSPVVITISGASLSVDPTAVTLSSSANPSLVGVAVKFTATVTGSGSGWTGAVNFLDGATKVCSAALGAGGVASCSVSTLTLGQHSITASYEGDANDGASVSAALLQVVKQAPALVLAVTPNPVTVTGNVVLTVTVTASGSGSGPVPTGTVVFSDGGTALGSAALSGGVAIFSTTALTPATHALQVQYAGDSATVAGQSNTVSEEVDQQATVTTLATSSATVQVGTTVTFTATVNCASGSCSGSLLPAGTVQFTAGGTAIGSAAVGSGGVATLTLSSLAPGVKNIVATYGGSTDDAGSASTPLVETVQQIGTTTGIAVDANPVSALATVHLTATVAMAAGATADGAITGEVTFNDGSAVLGTAALNSNGVATLAVSTLSVGQHAISASYGGNTNYAGSSSSALSEAVSLTPSTTVAAGGAGAMTGAPVTLTATVSGANGVATGTVKFFDGGSQMGAGILNAQGVATLTVGSMTVGIHTVVAVYGGDASFGNSSSNGLVVTVAQDPTTTALAVSANPTVAGQNVTFTANVTSVSQGFSGTVNFLDGGVTIGQGTLSAAGVASYTTNALGLGSHAISAAYAGDTNHAGSASASVTELVVQGVTVGLQASANPSIAGASLTFSVKVVGTAVAVPSGAVSFTDGATVIGAATLDVTGTAILTTTALSVGSHIIGVSYAGDGHYAPGSAQMTETVQSAGTQIALTASANPAIYGTSLGLTAAIASTGGVATGTVTFTDGGATIGTGTLDASGVAKLAISTLTPAAHNIVANYAGDGKAGTSVSTPLPVEVEELTSAVVSSNANPAQTLASVVLTATVTNSGVGQPTGTVTFMDGGAAIGSSTLDASGRAALTVPSLAAGNHVIVASYVGDGQNFPTVSAGMSEGVTLRTTGTAVSATQTSASNPLQVTLISVVRWTGPTAPTGTVTFTTGTGAIGASALNSTGVATITITLASASEIITASYSGDAEYAASVSPATTVTGGPATQFTMALSPSDMTVASKEHGTVNMTIASVAGFADTLQFGCLGLPFAATCTFSSSNMALKANGGGVVQVTIDTGDPLGAGAQAMNTHGPANSGLMMCFLPGGLLVGGALYRARKRPMVRLLIVLLAVAASMGLSGCSGLNVNGTPAGTYQFKVTASGQGTGATQFQVMTLTVK